MYWSSDSLVVAKGWRLCWWRTQQTQGWLARLTGGKHRGLKELSLSRFVQTSPLCSCSTCQCLRYVIMYHCLLRCYTISSEEVTTEGSRRNYMSGSTRLLDELDTLQTLVLTVCLLQLPVTIYVFEGPFVELLLMQVQHARHILALILSLPLFFLRPFLFTLTLILSSSLCIVLVVITRSRQQCTFQVLSLSC